MIEHIKKAIDFAMFTAAPNSWDDTTSNSSKLGMYLQLVQDQINGMATTPVKIDPESQAKLKKLKKKVTNKISSLERKRSKGTIAEQEEIRKRIKELKNSLKELETIIVSTVNYTFEKSKYPEFSYDKSTNVGTIKYDRSIGSLLNELKHAFQFETGKIDFFQTKDSNGEVQISGGLLYDVHDEIETYKRQYAYDGTIKFRVQLESQDLMNKLRSGKLDLGDLQGAGSVEIKKINLITADVIVKVADGIAKKSLYSTISTKPLDTNSSVGDVISGNAQRQGAVHSLGLNNFDSTKPYIEFVKVYISQNIHIYVK